jgi:hypothetical protein
MESAIALSDSEALRNRLINFGGQPPGNWDV